MVYTGSDYRDGKARFKNYEDLAAQYVRESNEKVARER